MDTSEISNLVLAQEYNTKVLANISNSLDLMATLELAKEFYSAAERKNLYNRYKFLTEEFNKNINEMQSKSGNDPRCILKIQETLSGELKEFQSAHGLICKLYDGSKK